MAKAVFDELAKPAPKNHFTVGICDDVTQVVRS
jgi:pyruvate-ferredoxin/flavodoxin oxidoreductase